MHSHMKQVVFILCLFCFGCKNDALDKGITANRSLKVDSISKFFEPEKQVFNLNITDSDIVIFTFLKSFDTSFAFQLRKVDQKIKGTLLFYPPDYYKDFYAAEHSDIFIYKAVNFSLDNKEKDILLQQFEGVSTEGLTKSSPYLHPVSCKIFFNKKFYSTEKITEDYFNQIYDVLNKRLFQRIFDYYPTVNGITL